MAAITNANTQEQVTAGKLEVLRQQMEIHNLDAYLIPSVDEHINEYLPENKQRRAWASSFTGSAGEFLLGREEAWVFADSRYHEQADYEVSAAHIKVSKIGLPNHPGVSDKIRELAQKAIDKGLSVFRLGFDPFTLTVQQAQAFQKSFEHTIITLVPVTGNLVDLLWQDAPPALQSEVFALPDTITGKSWQQKLKAVQEKLIALKIDVLPITKLDQIAWLFNLRGQDIPYNPVFIAYAIVTQQQAFLFMDASRIRAGDSAQFAGLVQLEPYALYPERLKELAAHKTVLIDPKHTTVGTLTLATQSSGQAREAEHPIEMMKALKNDVEIRKMKEANLKASRGKIRAWYWLDQQLAAGKTVTEDSFKEAIEAFYTEEEGFIGLSFNTISGAGANSSIVHYGTPDPHKTLEPGELFLIDSGCQFYGGTTDDTRTLLIGNQPTAVQKLRFTEVLKAHINCAMQKFPQGTDGIRLDGITRATLWQQGLDYGHGTGHGVGAFLNVHEGPNGIHRLASRALEPGMITSIEPGFYEPGWGGIRLENLYQVVNCPQKEAEKKPEDTGMAWYGFESLTFIPFEPKLIDFTRMSADQKNWLHAYYEAILSQIGPTSSEEEAAWLKTICTF